MNVDKTLELLDRKAREFALFPASRPQTPAPRSSPTPEQLADLLRNCPTDHLPVPADPPPDPTPPNSAFRVPRSALGTPAAKSWDAPWLELVNAAERKLGRRVCGARQIDGTPCELRSDHPTGRCRFHGGFDLTGAPPGNRNAYIHGLYSRRLKTCGDHCPHWSSCPMVQPDLETVPHKNRPTCPYEQAQYNTALADALDLSSNALRANPFAIHIAHNIATLQVILGRAATEIRNTTIVSETNAKPEKHTSTHEQVRPHINAISRIGAELRKYIAMLPQTLPRDLDYESYQQRRRDRREALPGPDPDQFQYVPPDQKLIARQREQKALYEAQSALIRAVRLANENKVTESFTEWEKASESDPTYTQAWTSRLRRSVQAKRRAEQRNHPPSRSFSVLNQS